MARSSDLVKSIFAINSCTKAFTGVAIMQLVEEGRVDLSAQYPAISMLFPVNGNQQRYDAAGESKRDNGNYSTSRDPDPRFRPVISPAFSTLSRSRFTNFSPFSHGPFSASLFSSLNEQILWPQFGHKQNLRPPTLATLNNSCVCC